jgi:succinyl-diaminopimelate desuccinylase
MTVRELAGRAAAAIDEGYVIQLAQQLVRARSVVGAGETEAAAAQVVASALSALGLTPTIEEVAPGRPNVIADWCGRAFDHERHRTLMFEGHTDVVTEGDPAQWRFPPFAATIAGGRLHGRGSCDMKGGIAAAIGALAAVMTVAPELPGRIRLGIVVDEEGMMLGIKHFIRQGWADAVSAAIICEPEENDICLFQKGAMRVAVTFKGRMSHGAMPYAGVNPIRALGDFLSRLAAFEALEQSRCGSHPQLGLPWMTPTIVRAPITGDAQHNVMPESAYLALDIRTVPGQEHDALLAALRKIAEGVEAAVTGVKVTLDCFEARPWTETPAEHPIVQAAASAFALLGETPRYGGVPGATDGTFLHAWAQVPIITMGPGERHIPHQRDESVALDELIRAARLYAATAILFLSNQGG